MPFRALAMIIHIKLPDSRPWPTVLGLFIKRPGASSRHANCEPVTRRRDRIYL